MSVTLPKIIAHRGSPREAPENTLASFRRAKLSGAAFVEFDVALTRDARPVIFHDDGLERTSDGQGLLADLDFELVKHLDAGSWFDRQFAGEPIPTLEETLELLAALGLGFNMELKTDPGREAELAKIALPIALDIWPKDLPTPLISSFSRIAVAAARETAPQWPMDVIYDRIPAEWAEDAKTLDLAVIGANHKHLTREQVMEFRGSGLKISSYTVNDVERAATLFQWGVDAIFTDVPGDMVKRFGP
ncbi:MAG: glycerophosphoryl diester phosphodiesterase [Rhodospirillaceae bacterium]|nr:glycerophosphoryl diester phosphodiesterase [Rhodospirillaceae bacterium]